MQSLAVSDVEVCKSFLKRGYLPEVFPPIFSSKAWSENIDFKKLVIDAPKEMELNKISYGCTKRGYGRRYFDFVHPASAVATSAWMSRHWKDVQAFCNKTNTAPIEIGLLDDDENRSVATCSFDKVLQESKQRLAGARYVVRADVAKYYSSIYTHVIPWALNGKEAAKKDRGPFSKVVFANELDWAIRIGQGNQTKGIPVGPDFSRAVVNSLDRRWIDPCWKKLATNTSATFATLMIFILALATSRQRKRSFTLCRNLCGHSSLSSTMTRRASRKLIPSSMSLGYSPAGGSIIRHKQLEQKGNDESSR